MYRKSVRGDKIDPVFLIGKKGVFLEGWISKWHLDLNPDLENKVCGKKFTEKNLISWVPLKYETPFSY